MLFEFRRSLRLPAAVLAAIAVLPLLWACGRGEDASGEAEAATAPPAITLPEDATEADLCDQTLSAADYEALCAVYPNCNILWSVPLSGGAFRSDSTELTLASFSDDDAALLEYFSDLTFVNAAGCRDYGALSAAAAALPDCQFYWTVEVAGLTLDNDCTELDLAGLPVDTAELSTALSGLPKLKRVYLTGTGLDARDLTELREAYPLLAFRADVSLGGGSCDTNSAELDLSGCTTLDFSELLDTLACFPALARVDLTGCGVPEELQLQLSERYPDVLFLWEVKLSEGVTVSSDEERYDLSEQTVSDFETFKRNFRLLSRAKYVNMCRCGLTDAQMEELMTTYPDVRFVWIITMGAWEIRTDVTAFSLDNEKRRDGVWLVDKKVNRYTTITAETIEPLRYCTDLIALDLGDAPNLTDISVVANLKNLKYLLISNTGVTDISPIAGLTELVFLELFGTDENLDITPLRGLLQLRQLNCSEIKNPDMETLLGLSGLTRLWVIQCGLSDKELAALQEALPTCLLAGEGKLPTANWRYHNAEYAAMQGLYNLPLVGQYKE